MARRRSTLLAALALVSLPVATCAGDAPQWPRKDYRSAAGVAVGLPQIIAVSMESEVTPHLRLQGNLGSAGALSSLCGRAIMVADDFPVQPYVFLGGGLFLAAVAHSGAAVPYGWYGVGMRLEIERVLLFAEGGRITLPGLFEADPDEYSSVGAVGLLVQY